ncbi:MAG: TetR/AcrR family transcriptional regulator [Deltaproteobacteria bacterium]|nr:TetR/AcrR family transcriptional regulator [Deltaproteobacteria bacterium]
MAIRRASLETATERTRAKLQKRAKSGPAANERSHDALEATTRERILASATRLFAEKGFEGASMPAIAKASGITAGAIYKHFEGKGELLLEVVMRSFLSSPLFAHSSERGNDTTAMANLAAAYTEPALKLVRQLSIEVHSGAARDAKVRHVLSKFNRLAVAHYSASVATAQQAGKLDPHLDPDHVARAFCILIMGLIHMDTLLPDLVGDGSWREFIRERAAALIGVGRVDPSSKNHSDS